MVFSSNAIEEIPTVSSKSSDVLHHYSHDCAAGENPTSPESQVSHGSTAPIYEGSMAWRHELTEGPTLVSLNKKQSLSSIDPLSEEDIDSIDKELRIFGNRT